MKNFPSPGDIKYTIVWREGACANSGRSRLKWMCLFWTSLLYHPEAPAILAGPYWSVHVLPLPSHTCVIRISMCVNYIPMTSCRIISVRYVVCVRCIRYVIVEYVTMRQYTHYNFNIILSMRPAFTRIVFEWYYYCYYLF